MEDITEFFIQVLEHCRSVDMAEAEFKRQINEDLELKQSYRDWCDISGESERDGFRDFCEEYIATQEEVWDTLKEFGDE